MAHLGAHPGPGPVVTREDGPMPPGERKKLEELLPGIIKELGPDNLTNLKKIAEHFQKQERAAADVPGETFEEAAKEA